MNSPFFEFPILRLLNTLLLAGILATQVLIFLHIRKPIHLSEPVAVETPHSRRPLNVEVVNGPLEVETGTLPLEVEIVR
jgi:hypothetical protein